MRKWNFAGKNKKKYRINLLDDVDYSKDEQVRYPGKAKLCYNVDTAKSVLKKARSFGTSLLNADLRNKGKYVTYFDKDNGYLVIVTENYGLKWYEGDGKGYFMNARSVSKVFSSTPRSLSYTLNGENVLFFCDDEGLYIWRATGAPEKLENAPLINNMTVHNERLFVTVQNDPYTLWFSDDLDPTNWSVSLTGAGFIKFTDERGKILNMISFGGYLYLFREYGISRMNAYGEQTDFAITHLFTPSGRIYENTVTLCGDRIMFCSSDGIFSFDGANAVRLLFCLDDYFKVNPDSCAGYYDGKYYVASYKDFEDDALGVDGYPTCIHNCVLEYNIFTKKFIMHRGLDIRTMCHVRNVDIVFVDDKNNLCVIDNYDRGDGGDMVEYFDFYGKWEMPLSDLGSPEEEKFLQTLSFYCDGKAEVFIANENECRSFMVTSSTRVQEIPVNMSGTLFSVGFKLFDSYMRIAKPTLIFY